MKQRLTIGVFVHQISWNRTIRLERRVIFGMLVDNLTETMARYTLVLEHG